MERLYETTLREDTLNYASEVLKENSSTRDDDIRRIVDWLSSEQYLHAKTDPVTVLRFLRGCKFDIEKTKKKLKAFYELRGNAPEWFTQRDPTLPAIQDLLSLGVFLPLLKKDPAGRLVVLIRVAAHNPRCHLQNDVFKVGKMTLDLAIEQDESVSVYGVTAVFDLTGVSLGHARQLTPSMIKKAVHAWQVHVHGFNLKSLHDVVPPEILPQEYGGSCGNLQDLIDHWKVKVTEAKEWFAEDELHKAEPQSQTT